MKTMKQRLVIAGGSGFLGRILAEHFQRDGYDIIVLTRSPKATQPGIREVRWDARTLGDWAREVDGAAVVINLTGRSVNCRYDARNRQEIMASRVDSTRVIGEAIAQCKTPPPVWLNASTATIYKHNFGPAWGEAGEIGSTPAAKDEFSIEVATAWERVFNEARTPRTRKIALRAAMVLGMDGNSVFPTLHRLTRFGLGGRMDDGKQFVSWIHQTDFCRAIEWLVGRDDISGSVNICAPNPLTNAEMMRVFREACGMPIGLPAAEWMLEIGALVMRTETELLIKSRRVRPQRLVEAGFTFRYPFMREAVEDLSGRIKEG
jgi:uncharacterized protein (TIGR01777 family)